MAQKYPNLFSPYEIRGIKLKNRILSAPIGISFFGPESHLTDYSIEFFEQRAKGGAATVTMGNIPVTPPTGGGVIRYPDFNLHGREAFSVLCKFAETMRQHGALASVQLNHNGPGQGCDFDVLPSVDKFGNSWRAATEDEVEATIPYFIDCAKALKHAGFQMLQLHCGHNWLIHRFLRPQNTRGDKWGGSFENRLRFPLAVVNGVREAVGEDFVIEVRITGLDPEKLNVEFGELVAFLNAVEDKIDIVNVSCGGLMLPREIYGHQFPSALDPTEINLEKAAALKARIKTPVACVGNILYPSSAERMIAEGKVDFVALGRALLADPEWPVKSRRGRERDIRPCLGCYKCLDISHRFNIITCDVNPTLGHEHRVKGATPAQEKRRVVIVGGGPAGMQAAITAHDRGHEVVLFEKENVLGGLLRISNNTQFKWRTRNFKNYLIHQVENRGIDLRLGIEATKELIEAERPDAVIAAAGSIQRIPDIPGIHGKTVVTATEIFYDRSKVTGKIAVIGGNMSGCEAAIALLDEGRDVTIVTGGLHRDLNFQVDGAYDLRLERARIIRDSRCEEITDGGVRVRGLDGSEIFIEADTVVIALGSISNDGLSREIMHIADDFSEIGDCLKPGTVHEATQSGYYTAMSL